MARYNNVLNISSILKGDVLSDSVRGMASVYDIHLLKKPDGSVYGSGTLLDDSKIMISFSISDEVLLERLISLKEHHDKLHQPLIIDIWGNIYKHNETPFIYIQRYEVIESPWDVGGERVEYLFRGYNEKDEQFKNIKSKLFRTVLDRLLEDDHLYSISEGRSLYYELFFDDVFDQFSTIPASEKIHNARFAGLLHHTQKMLDILALLLKQHEDFGLNRNGKDLLIFSILFLNISQAYEEHPSSYGQFHVKYLVKHKDLIIRIKDEDFYSELYRVFCDSSTPYKNYRSLFAYITDKIRQFDIEMTFLSDHLSKECNEISLPFDQDTHLEVPTQYFSR